MLSKFRFVKARQHLRKDCKQCEYISQKKWRGKNSEYMKRYGKKWREENENYFKKYFHTPEHKEYIKKYLKEYMRKYIVRHPKLKLRQNISRSIRYSLNDNKRNKHWETLVGYTLQDLKKHLEKQFQKGMTWKNYGEWHIDHKIPVSVFNFEKPEDIDFKRCWALKNLQPMWAIDNLRKHDKLEKPFQPSLAMA